MHTNSANDARSRLFRYLLPIAMAAIGCLVLVGCAVPPETTHVRALMPPAAVEAFLPELMSADRHAHAGVIAPGGDLVFYVSSDLGYEQFDIQVVRVQGDGFSAPTVVDFDTTFSDHAPAFYPSGAGLLFSSTRPLPGDAESRGWRIWTVGNADGENVDVGASRPLTLDDSSLDVLSHASLTQAGDLVFHGLRTGTQVEYDIYSATARGDGFDSPVLLGPAVNSPGIEVTPFVDPAGRYLIFAAYDREDGFGGGDLYVSSSDGQGGWLPARNLGPAINGPGEESNPFVTADGTALLFSSSRSDPPDRTDLNLYWIATASLDLLPR